MPRCAASVGVPTYALTDNPRTVSIDHVAGIPVRHPQIVEAARHCGMTLHTCVPSNRNRRAAKQRSRSPRQTWCPPPRTCCRPMPRSPISKPHVTASASRQRSMTPGKRGRSRRGAGRGTRPPAHRAVGPAHPGTGHHPPRRHRPDDPVRVGALFDPTRAGRRRSLGACRRNRAGHRRRPRCPAAGSAVGHWAARTGRSCRHRLSTPGNPQPTDRSCPRSMARRSEQDLANW